MTQKCKPLYSTNLPPLLKRIDEPVFGLGDFSVGVFTLDTERGTGAPAVAQEVKRPDLPPGAPREHVVVAVEEGEAGAVAVEHDKVVFGVRLSGAGHGELIDYTVVAGEGDHIGGAGARAMGVGFGRGGGGGRVAVGRGEGGVGFFVEGEKREDCGLGGGGGDRGPLEVLVGCGVRAVLRYKVGSG